LGGIAFRAGRIERTLIKRTVGLRPKEGKGFVKDKIKRQQHIKSTGMARNGDLVKWGEAQTGLEEGCVPKREENEKASRGSDGRLLTDRRQEGGHGGANFSARKKKVRVTGTKVCKRSKPV